MQKDLFGNPVKKKKSHLELQLAKYDRETFDERIKRLKYIESIAPKGYSMVGSMEAIFIFHEAETAFINGGYIGTIILTQAFIERRLQDYMEAKGVSKEAKRNFKAILEYFRENQLLNERLLEKIDHLREIRNPFTHLKPIDHPYAMSQRIAQELKEPFKILETEAKDALALMYTVFMAKL